MKIIGITTSLILMVALSSIFSGYALSVLWGWFVMPFFGLKELSIPMAIGLALIVTYLTHQDTECLKKDQDTSEKIIEMVAKLIAKPLFALGFGWIVALFI